MTYWPNLKAVIGRAHAPCCHGGTPTDSLWVVAEIALNLSLKYNREDNLINTVRKLIDANTPMPKPSGHSHGRTGKTRGPRKTCLKASVAKIWMCPSLPRTT